MPTFVCRGFQFEILFLCADHTCSMHVRTDVIDPKRSWPRGFALSYKRGQEAAIQSELGQEASCILPVSQKLPAFFGSVIGNLALDILN